MLLIPISMVWFFKGFYPERKFTTIILRVLAIFGMMLLGLIILGIVGVIAGFIIGYSRNIK